MRRTILILAAINTTTPASGWDSVHPFNPTHSTHSHLTECALKLVKSAELNRYRKALVDGSNYELHEVPFRGGKSNIAKYDVDLEAKRRAHLGTNAGSDDVAGWWQESLAAYRADRVEQAYFFLGIMLHMVQDMGVPAHANGIPHQGKPGKFDNFEFMATFVWRPNFKDINRKDPAFRRPWRYYALSKSWTRADAPNYSSRSSFSTMWWSASTVERRLLSNRQGRTCMITAWTLASAQKAFRLGL